MQSEEELIKIGTSLLDTFKYKKAIEVFTDAIKMNSFNSEIYTLRGMANYQILNIEDALADFSRAVALDPSNHEAWFNKGEICWQRKEYNEAHACYLEADRIYPDSLFYLSGLVLTSHALKKYSKTINYCNQILKEKPADAFALWHRGSANGQQQNYNGAIKDFLKIIEVGKANGTTYNNLGFWYSKIEDIKKAHNNLSICLQLNPTDPYALNNMGYVKYLEKNYQEAIEFINSSLEIDSSNSYAYKNMALVYLKIGDKKLAMDALEKARELGYYEDYGNEVNELLKKNLGSYTND